MPKVFSGVQVRALEFFHSKPFLHGPPIVHESIVKLEQIWTSLVPVEGKCTATAFKDILYYCVCVQSWGRGLGKNRIQVK